jgi:RNA polymerase subunit RPABC4/transcription elongation factor Spt4
MSDRPDVHRCRYCHAPAHEEAEECPECGRLFRWPA